ncbi:hypothetical protein [Streptomyces acidiscabies]|uniref:Secreted protein n=1 Tax=Streptomyces acidiscabies TaxID=42234 RepID=A0AAP6EK52_9ACTN|nr:hypothetical protein [Streptomyces acidiscabies]MBP5939151.1 hypothetical protein [Streptomyces sp. LBUM 1476]MBZ3910269.1 hypothetical protein [Streptomyces acidiscabies]MDX2965211.1 hypothetical protein [Streptomyces acidiscabies]MDX3023559.1 hypothetical protein [Streptomyces acidiscabies]MDX3789637.1 hypothetical protein [Streptomyces acidiscabies]
MKTRGRRAASIAASACALAAGLVLAGPVNPASAAPNVYFASYTFTDGSGRIDVYNDGDYAGTAEWAADPGDFGSSTGDTLIASDQLADGYGIVAHLSDGRTASTRGYSSPFTDRTTGDLDEGADRTMWVCYVQDTYSKCSDKIAVHA